MSSDKRRPVQDLGLPKPAVPFHAGGRQQVNHKSELADTGSIGYTPRGTGAAGHVHDVLSQDQHGRHPEDDELELAPRPLPREQPVSETPTHMGNYVRFLDGHSELHRARPGLVALMNHPSTSEEDRADIRQEIADRDAIHNHRYW